jgi:hypothetical protein
VYVGLNTSSNAGPRGKNGKDQRSFGFAQAFGRGMVSLNHAACREDPPLRRNALETRTGIGMRPGF